LFSGGSRLAGRAFLPIMGAAIAFAYRRLASGDSKSVATVFE
jgi:hypothetical protein